MDVSDRCQSESRILGTENRQRPVFRCDGALNKRCNRGRNLEGQFV